MTGFVFLRVRAHRLLVTAALLAVLLTTAVLATLAAFSGSVGDAGLRHALQTRDAAAASLIIKAESPEADRAEAVQVRSGARQSFDELPVTLREFHRSGPYALPRGLQPMRPPARASPTSPRSPWRTAHGSACRRAPGRRRGRAT